ncbi:hypothetical protein [Marinicella litoralis]|nr:hypothetical protein [Marinicella litoralis]
MKFKAMVGFCLMGLMGDFAFAAQHETKPELDELSWDQQFQLHLLNSDDSDLQAFGLLQLSSVLTAPMADERVVKQVKKAIKSLSERGDLSSQALFIMTNVCHSQLEPGVCDQSYFIAKQLQDYPDDMAVYLSPLNQAFQLEIEGEVFDLVKQMAATPYLSNHSHYSQAYEDALHSYFKQHPFSDSMIDEALVEHLNWFHRDDEISEELLEGLRQNMPENILLIKMIVSELSMPILPYKGLMDACRTYDELSEECLTIADKLTSLSKDYIGIIIGLAIPEQMYEAQGLIQKHQEALFNKEQKKAEVACLGKLVNVSDIFGENRSDMSERFKVTRQAGERAGMIHHANLLYQRALLQDAEQAEAMNPEHCLVE